MVPIVLFLIPAGDSLVLSSLRPEPWIADGVYLECLPDFPSGGGQNTGSCRSAPFRPGTFGSAVGEKPVHLEGGPGVSVSG